MMTLDRQQINGVVVKVLLDGPTRVVTETDGGCVLYAADPESAARQGVRSDVVWVRDDGWTLGATFIDASAAKSLWAGDWVAYLDLTTGEVYFID